MISLNNTGNQISAQEKKVFRTVFFRSYLASLDFSMVKMMTVGFTMTVLPWLKYLYPDDKEKFAEAMSRHKPFFNVTPDVMNFITGLVLAMEKEYKGDPENFDPASISAIKAALMGPMSGVGDAIFWVTVRTIAASIAIGLAQNGMVFAPIVFLLMYHIPSTLMRWFSLKYGYTLGNSFVETAYESGAINMLTKAATSIGLIMVGAMVANFVNLSTPIVLSGADTESPQLLQSALDTILPGLLPLCVTLFTLYLLRKGVNPSLIILGMIIVGIGGKAIGVF